MKRVGDIQVLRYNEKELRLGSLFVASLGIREGAVLYGAALVSQSRESSSPDTQTEHRVMTLIITPFPHSAWPRLIRMSVTIDSSHGSLFQLIKNFRSLRLFPRHLEDVTGASLENSSSYPMLASQRSAAFQRRDDPIVPSATFVLELPIEQEPTEHTPPSLTALHSALRKVIEDPRSSASAILELETALEAEAKREKSNYRKVSVQWISPMATLNRLYGAPGSIEKLHVTRLPGSDRLGVSLLPWSRVLWPPGPTVPSGDSFIGESTILAMPSFDSDEKIVAWYFYRHTDRLVVQFEIIVPAFGLEHCWWEYTLHCVHEARGTILGSSNLSRLNGRWGTLQCTAMFPLKDKPDQPELIEPIIRCFRNLQGDISHSAEFEKLQSELKKEQHKAVYELLPEEARDNWRSKSLNFSSQLERLVVTDPFEGSSSPRFGDAFAENPFSFTRPLDLLTYTQLYGDLSAENAQGSRRLLAEDIIRKLSRTPGENIAIVGAHRAGKTTVLNLVYDRLVEDLAKTSGMKLIPIFVNAAVTPPHMLFLTIVEKVTKLKEFENFKNSLRLALAKIYVLARGVLRAIDEVRLPAGISVTPSKVLEREPGVSTGPMIASDEQLRSLLVRVAEERQDVLAGLLRDSLELLREAVNELQTKDQEFRLVVVMDEFSEMTTWGDAQTLAVWRHAVEYTSDFGQIKWLFSTTRPMREAAEYSPITNIFLEVNVGSLRKQECTKMIDAFAVTAWNNDRKQPEKLRPIITHPARLFLIEVTSGLPYLLQVTCYHVYELATRTEFPLINKRLCRRTILRKVLLEMADYLEHQWKMIPEAAQRFILESLPKNIVTRENLTPERFLESFGDWLIDPDRMPPGSLKALDRSGLRGDDGRCVAPLVAAWLLSREMR